MKLNGLSIRHPEIKINIRFLWSLSAHQARNNLIVDRHTKNYKKNRKFNYDSEKPLCFSPVNLRSSNKI